MKFHNICISLPHANTIFKISTNSCGLRDYLTSFFEETEPNSRHNREYHIYYNESNGALVLNQNQFDCAVDASMSRISTFIRENITFDENWMLLHGSAVKINDQVYLFLGSTGAGKTTLLAFLSCQPSFRIVSEDLTIINSITGEVVSRTMPLALRRSSYELLITKYNCNIFAEKETYNQKLLYEPNYQPVISPHLYVREAFLIDRKSSTLQCLPTPHASNIFIENAVCYRDMINIVKSAFSLSHRVHLRTLVYQDLFDVKDFLVSISKVPSITG